LPKKFPSASGPPREVSYFKINSSDGSECSSKSAAEPAPMNMSASYESVMSTLTVSSTNSTSSSKPMAKFIRHVSYPDSSVVLGGSVFIKTWRIKNDGAESWPSGCVLVNAGGDLLFPPTTLGVRVPVAAVPASQETDVSIHLTAPRATGRYQGYFRLQTGGGKWFGQRLWADIRVNADATCGAGRAEPLPSSASVSCDDTNDDMITPTIFEDTEKEKTEPQRKKEPGLSPEQISLMESRGYIGGLAAPNMSRPVPCLAVSTDEETSPTGVAMPPEGLPSTDSVLLPKKPAAAAAPTHPTATGTATARRPIKTILVVCGSEADRRMHERLIEKSGYQCMSCADGQACVSMVLDKWSEGEEGSNAALPDHLSRIDALILEEEVGNTTTYHIRIYLLLTTTNCVFVIIVNYILQVSSSMSGFDIVTTLREMNLQVPIIGIYCSPEGEQRFRSCGANVVSSNPLSQDDLRIALVELETTQMECK
jgi:CheY-like chemotaxis protein